MADGVVVPGHLQNRSHIQCRQQLTIAASVVQAVRSVSRSNIDFTSAESRSSGIVYVLGVSQIQQWKRRLRFTIRSGVHPILSDIL